MGPDRVPGCLYDFGRYPGAVRRDKADQWIHGEVLPLRRSVQLLALLDEYEGPEFERAIVPVTGIQECWIYWYVGQETGRLIASGDWF